MNKSTRDDGLYDVVRGLRPYTDTGAAYTLPDELYQRDGIAATVVDKPAEDAMAFGFEIEGDEGDLVLNEMDRLYASIHLTDAIRFARLYGASAILMLVQDGAPMNAPLVPENVRQLDDLIVYEGSKIFAETDRYNNPAFRNYGKPIYFRITPNEGLPFVVHESRLIKFSGLPAGGHARFGVMPWPGRSVLETCIDSIKRYRDGLRLAKYIMERKQQAVHSMTGLSEMLQSAEGKAIVQEKILMTDSVRGLLNGVTIDGGPGNGQGDGDKYTVIDLSLGGIDSVLGEFRDAISADTRIAQTVLFGSDVKGLGSTGTGEQSIYHSLVKNIQERDLRPAMEQLAAIIWAQRTVAASEPERWRIKFHPLFSPSARDVAEVDQMRANARKVHMEAVISAASGYLITQDEARLAANIAFPELELDKGKAPDFPDELPDDAAANDPAEA